MLDTFSKIDRENRLLLEKISDILAKKDCHKSPSLDTKNDSFKHIKSLNNSFRKKELERITKENHQILKRIQNSTPMYDHTSWERDRRQQEQYLKNICEYGYGAQKPKRRTRTRKKRSKLALYAIENQRQHMNQTHFVTQEHKEAGGMLIPKIERIGTARDRSTDDEGGSTRAEQKNR